MSAIKQIQCPACGANSTFKQTDGSYRCNYCQSNFELKESLKKSQPQRTTVTFDNPVDMKPVKRGCGIAGLSVFISMIGVGVALFLNFKNNPGLVDGIESVFSEWQKPSLTIYQSFVGSKGPVIWEISQQTRNKLDSAKYSIEIIDPRSKIVLNTKPVFEPMTWTESFTFGKKLDGQFFQLGDIAYNSSEENGLIGFDIYAFEVVVNAETLGKKFQELNSGISKADFMWYKEAFNIITNKGDEFVYYPRTELLRTKTKDDNSYRSDTITDTKVYLSDEKQAQLYLIQKKHDKTRDELKADKGLANEYEKNKSYYRSSYNIHQFKKLSDRVFFKSEPILRTNDALVFMYVDDLSKKAKVHLECVDKDGNSKWKNSDEILQELKNSDNLSFEHRSNEDFLTISLWGAKRKTHCFDLKTGQLIWSYSPEK